MKSLDQIEARTPISAVPYTISAPGSYYLTACLSVTSGSAITIATSDVTLDLNGFTLASTEASPTGTGILLAGGNADITILNGHIKGGVTNNGGVYGGQGFANGIYYTGGNPDNVLVSHVSVSGCLDYGICLNGLNLAATVVEFCPVHATGSSGIVANNVSHCVANQCGNTGIFAFVASDCYGVCSGNGSGLAALSANNCQGQSYGSEPALSAGMADNCQGQNNSSGAGLQASETATGCYGVSANGVGLSATTANNCTGLGNGNADGLDSVTANNCQGQCSGTGIGTGLSASSANTCTGHGNGFFDGLDTVTAINCQGVCADGTGLNASQTAMGSYSLSTGFGIGMNASSANTCIGQGYDKELAVDYIAIGC